MTEHQAVDKINAHKGLMVNEDRLVPMFMGILFDDQPQVLKKYLLGNGSYSATVNWTNTPDGSWVGVAVPGLKHTIAVDIMHDKAAGKVTLGEASIKW